MTEIIPAEKYVILRPTAPKTKSGIETIQADKDMPQIGEVVKIGKGKLPLPLVVGDIAVYQKYMTNKTFVPQFNEDYDFIKFDNLVAVIKEEKNGK